MAEPRRISQTLIKPLANSPEAPNQGFRAELPGWDLATLLQLACARGERACVEVRRGDRRGYVYLNEGRLMHATLDTLVGEAAIAELLSWPGGEFTLCERPWPRKPSIDERPDVVLLRLAQVRDETAQRVIPRPTAFARPGAQPAPAPSLAARPPVPVSVALPAPAREAPLEGPVLASVRIDINGEIVAIQGHAETLAPLVGYVTRMGALLALQLGLEPFEALSADLGKQRALIFSEGDEMVGLMLGPGALHQELRHQLGV
ncbi:MAG TPA: DUF4388 domain-containing protein [Polyangiales bacterium]